MRHLLLILAILVIAESISWADFIDYKNNKVFAVQNKAFTLKNEVRINPVFIPFDAYTKGLGVGLSYSYHFSDTFAWDVFGINLITSYEKSLRRDLVENYNADTEAFKEYKYIVDSSIRYTPFYYKGVFFDDLILHGHGYFLLGPSTLRVKDNSGVEAWKIGNHLGLGFNIITSSKIIINISMKDHMYYSEKVLSHVTLFSIGFGFNFGGQDE